MILTNKYIYSYQYIIGDDNMNKDRLWEMFCKTGDIMYYLEYKRKDK